MKPTRFLTVVLVLLGLVAMVNAAGTPAGTVIANQAKGAYMDANGNEVAGETAGYVFSNTVSTTVSQLAGADVSDTPGQNVSALGSVLYDLTFTNTGNGTDTFGLYAADNGGQTGDFVYQIWHDIDNNGAIDGSDTVAVSTGPLAADGSFNLLIKVMDMTVGGAPEADQLVVTITAISGFNGSVTDATDLTTTVQAATVAATISIDNSSPIPGDVVTYTICITNSGSAIAYNVVFVSPIPGYTTYSTNSIRTGATYAGGTLVTDIGGDDNGDFNVTSPDTITVNLGNIAGLGGSVCVYYKVTINAGTPEGTPIEPTPLVEFENLGGTLYPAVNPTGDTSIDVVESFGVDIAFAGATGEDSFTGDPSDTLFYPFTVQNLGNGTDNFSLSPSATYVVWTFYADDGDGVLSTAELTAGAIIATGNLTQNQTASFVAVGIIPAGTEDTAVDNTTFTATSQDDPSETDTATAQATCTAPVVTLLKSSPQGYDIDAMESEVFAAPGATLTYTIVVTNTGSGEATNVIVSDAIPDNTSYVLGTMKVGGIVVDDDNDSDGAAYTGTAVVWDLGSMASGASLTLSFEVTID